MTEQDKLRVEKERTLSGKLGKGEDELTDVETAGKLLKTPESTITHGARGFCRFEAALQPKRLLPGQSGTVLITMVLEGDSVLASPPTLSVKPANSALAVGGWSIRPAGLASVAKAFKGRAAYDNWAVIEVPVTMPATAPLGTKQFLALDLEFELLSGSNATPLGRFDDRLSVACEVGATSDPGVATNAARAPTVPSIPAAARTTPVAETVAKLPPAEQKSAVVATPGNVRSETAGPGESGSAAEPGHGLLPTESSGSTFLLLGAGGLVLIGALVALLRRR